MNSQQQDKLSHLSDLLEALYREHQGSLLFHGWHHISFVVSKTKQFAASIGADVFLAVSAALVHDLNYIAEPNSEPIAGRELRKELLARCGYEPDEVTRIEGIIGEAHTATRSQIISDEGKALSDADTVFKALPITPVLFSSKYLTENRIDIRSLSSKIMSEQTRLLASGYYFYIPSTNERYIRWAKANLELWNCISESLEDEDVQDMLNTARKFGVDV